MSALPKTQVHPDFDKKAAERMRFRPNVINPVVPTTHDEVSRFATMVTAAIDGGKDTVATARRAYIIHHGLALGLTPTEALASLYVSREKIVMSAELIRARIFASGVVTKWDYKEDTKLGCVTLEVERIDPDVKRFSVLHLSDFSHLTGSVNAQWNHYPYRMLSARMTTWIARDMFPDVLKGVLSYEEASEIAGHEVTPMASRERIEASIADMDELAVAAEEHGEGLVVGDVKNAAPVKAAPKAKPAPRKTTPKQSAQAPKRKAGARSTEVKSPAKPEVDKVDEEQKQEAKAKVKSASGEAKAEPATGGAQPSLIERMRLLQFQNQQQDS